VKALSIRRPWAYFIIYGIPYGVSVDNGDGSSRIEDSGKVILKDVENRSWPVRLALPQRIVVHVGKRVEPIEDAMPLVVGKLRIPAMGVILSYSTLLPRGALIGEVDLVECVTESKSPWFVGPYGFVLANPVPYEKPIPCRGRLGFFEPEHSSKKDAPEDTQ